MLVGQAWLSVEEQASSDAEEKAWVVEVLSEPSGGSYVADSIEHEAAVAAAPLVEHRRWDMIETGDLGIVARAEEAGPQDYWSTAASGSVSAVVACPWVVGVAGIEGIEVDSSFVDWAAPTRSTRRSEADRTRCTFASPS